MNAIATALFASVLAAPSLADPCEAPLPPEGQTFEGHVTYIVDGDGLCVGHTKGGIEVRLADFCAPELSQPGGEEAKRALSGMVLAKIISCVAGKKSFDRTVAVCTLDGVKLGDGLRKLGIAEGGRGDCRRN